MKQTTELLLGLIFISTQVWAQVGTAQINGTVTDETGSAISGADVKVTQTDTGQVRTVATGTNGSYVLPNLPTGPYRMEVSKSGFAQFVQSGIVLQVASVPTLDVVLKLGAVNEQVQVEATAVQVETQATGVGQVIDSARVVDLPLNGRNPQQLITLAGAAVTGGLQSTTRGYPTQLISVGGGLNNGLTYVLDGGSHNEPYINAGLPLPFPDALQEFKVDTSSVPAQYGQHSAGAIEAVTKSGSNEFHGDLFEFLRNGDLNARNTFAPVRDGLKRNQFGGVIGGPVRKNELFFFFGDQFTRTRSVPSTVVDTIPTPQVLAGDWTAITGPACNGGRQIKLNAPFVNNTISPSLYSPAAVNLVKHFPVVTNLCGRDVFGRVNNSNEQFIVARVDFQQSQKNQLFGRYMEAILHQISDYNGKDILSASQPNFNRNADSFVLGDTYVINPSLVSSSRATLLRTVNVKSTPDFFNFSSLGVQGIYSASGYPKITEVVDGGLFNLFKPTLSPGNTNSTDWQLAQDFSMTHGPHQISFGVNYIRTGLNYLSATNADGQYTFRSTTGSAMGDLMLGRAATFVQSQLVGWYPRQHYFATYVQDAWKVNRNLTVIAGLRWEPYLSPYTKYVQTGFIDNAAYIANVHSKVFSNAPAGVLFGGDPGYPLGSSLEPNVWSHVAPRLGLAWDPKGNGRMVIRASAGKFYEYTHFDTYGDLLNSPPTGGRVALTGVSLDNPWAGVPGGSVFPLGFGPNALFVPNSTYVNVPKGIKQSYIEQWNFSIQKQIGTSWLIAASYLGNLGVHGIQGHEGNPAIYVPGNCIAGQYGLTAPGPCSNPDNEDSRRLLTLENPSQGKYFSTVATVDSNGSRSYNGLVLSAQRRVSNGFSVLANYTWSHCIDFQTLTDTTVAQGWDLNQLKHDRGDCELDRRHVFNLSAVYNTPKFANKTAQLLLTGWQIAPIVSIHSGAPLTISSGNDNALTGTADQWASLALPSAVYASNKGTGTMNWLNANAFVQPADGTYGNVSPGNIKGPGYFDIDIALSRIFKLRERYSIELRGEAFNLFNHVNPGDPTTTTGALIGGVDATLSDSNFGQITSALDPRILQIAAKFTF